MINILGQGFLVLEFKMRKLPKILEFYGVLLKIWEPVLFILLDTVMQYKHVIHSHNVDGVELDKNLNL